MSPRVVICDPDSQRSARMAAWLAAAGFPVRLASDLPATQWLREACDVVLAGLESFRAIDWTGQALPANQRAEVFVLTGDAPSAVQAHCLAQGADDLVPAAIGLPEIALRLRLAAWRAKQPEHGVYTDGALAVDVARRSLKRRGRTLPCTPNEFKLIELLVRRGGRPLSVPVLREGLWGSAEAGSLKSLGSYIRSIRNKIERDPDRPTILRSESDVGYRWVFEAI